MPAGVEELFFVYYHNKNYHAIIAKNKNCDNDVSFFFICTCT